MKGARKQGNMPVCPIDHSAETSTVMATLDDRIRVRAYEIYKQCGSQGGFSECNWLQAEVEILAGKTLAIAA